MKELINLKEEILAGKIFIYPTDTIYGIGCNALDVEAVDRIKDMKGRDKDKPMSVIAPSVEWIRENCVVDVDLEKYLPGAYTLILKKKDPDFLKHVASGDTLGVRIPDCEFTAKVQEAGVPVITTSVNKGGEKPANSVSDIDKEILNKVDFAFDYGELSGRPSTLVIGGKEIER